MAWRSSENIIGETVVVFLALAGLLPEDPAREVNDVVDAAYFAPRVALAFLEAELDAAVVVLCGDVLRYLGDLCDHVHLVVVEEHLHVLGQLLHVQEELVHDVELLYCWLAGFGGATCKRYGLCV